MQKRGLIIALVLVLLIGFSVGYYIPKYKAQKQQQLAVESSFSNDAWALYNKGNFDDAIIGFNSYIRNDKENFAAHIGLAWSYYEKENYQNSLGFFSRAAEINPNSYEPYNGLAWVYYAIEDYENAARAFEQAIRLNPDIANLYNGLGRSYFALGEYERARQIYNMALSLNPSLVFSRAGLFLIDYETGNFGQMENYLNRLVPFKYDLGFKPDKHYVAFGNCMFVLNKENKNLNEEIHNCGLLMWKR